MNGIRNFSIAAALVAAGAAAGYWAAQSKQQAAPQAAGPVANAPAHPASPPSTAADAPKPERKVLYWHDPMVPQHKFDKPGKSPFMDMDLVPVYEEESGGGGVRIDSRVMQNLGTRTAKAERMAFSKRIDAVGTVRIDETRISVVQPRIAGYIERIRVNFLNQPVQRGEVLFELTSPELVAAQEEFLLARRANDAALAAAARQRLIFLGMTDAQVGSVAASGAAIGRIPVAAPAAGVVTEIAARIGMNVVPGTPLYTIADLGSVWVIVEIPEADAGWVLPGRPAEVSFAALPGETLKGTVDFIYPEINAQARTLKARIRVANPGNRIKPNMLAQAALFGSPKKDALAVPSEAVIMTGTRSVVIVQERRGGETSYRPADVRTGIERDGRTEILSGLAEGSTVVVSGQFLIDSEANLRTALGRLGAGAPAAAETGSAMKAPAAADQASHEAHEAHGAHGAQGAVGKDGKRP
jgi:Cu(I)/Ag(I) efflux system membrane fusion protein